MTDKHKHSVIDGLAYKYCTKCETHKTLNQFNKQTKAYDGLSCYCRDCVNKHWETLRSEQVKPRIKHEYSNNEEVKECFSCGIKKGLKSYSKNLHIKDGLSNICKECQCIERTERQNYIDTYRKSYREAFREYAKNNRLNRPPEEKQKIKEHMKEYCREHFKRNKEMYYKRQRKYRAKKLEVSEHYTVDDRNFTGDLFHNACANCGSTKNIELDHHYPLSKGYALTRSNAVLLCRFCNRSKGNKDPSEFYSVEKLSMIENKLKSKKEKIK